MKAITTVVLASITLVIITSIPFHTDADENLPPDGTDLLSIIEAPISVRQYEDLEVRFRLDPCMDLDNVSLVHNVLLNISGIPSIAEQMGRENLTEGIDWSLTPLPDREYLLSLDVDEQSIWLTPDGMRESVYVTVAIRARYLGINDTETVTVELKDLNEEPMTPEVIDISPDGIFVGDEVTFSTERVKDPDMDDVFYHWDIGDPVLVEGREFTVVFDTPGHRYVQLYASDGELHSDPIGRTIHVKERPISNETMSETVDESGEKEDGPPWRVALILAIIVVAFLLGTLVVAFITRRKKEPKEKKKKKGLPLDVIKGPRPYQKRIIYRRMRSMSDPDREKLSDEERLDRDFRDYLKDEKDPWIW